MNYNRKQAKNYIEELDNKKKRKEDLLSKTKKITKGSSKRNKNIKEEEKDYKLLYEKEKRDRRRVHKELKVKETKISRLEKEVDNKNIEIRNYKNEVSKLNKKLTELEREVVSYKKRINDTENLVHSQLESLKSAENRIIKLYEEVDRWKSRAGVNAGVKKTISSKDKIIGELRWEIAHLKKMSRKKDKQYNSVSNKLRIERGKNKAVNKLLEETEILIPLLISRLNKTNVSKYRGVLNLIDKYKCILNESQKEDELELVNSQEKVVKEDYVYGVINVSHTGKYKFKTIDNRIYNLTQGVYGKNLLNKAYKAVLLNDGETVDIENVYSTSRRKIHSNNKVRKRTKGKKLHLNKLKYDFKGVSVGLIGADVKDYFVYLQKQGVSVDWIDPFEYGLDALVRFENKHEITLAFYDSIPHSIIYNLDKFNNLEVMGLHNKREMVTVLNKKLKEIKKGVLEV